MLITIFSIVCIGPWSVGEIIEGYIGVIFAWGTIVNGSYLPGSFTYAYGFLQVCISLEKFQLNIMMKFIKSQFFSIDNDDLFLYYR